MIQTHFEQAVTTKDLEQLARETMQKEHYDYYAGGAGLEDCLTENERVFRETKILPRALINVEKVDTSVTLFGHRLHAPLFISPMGLQHMAHSRAELATAEAAYLKNIGFVLSTFASKSIEEVAEVNSEGLRLFQLYLLKDKDIVRSLIYRAEHNGYKAIVLTIDVPAVGKRLRDQKNQFNRFESGNAHILNDPVFQEKMNYPSTNQEKLEALNMIFPNPSVTWEDVKWLREETSLPILIKGILRKEDARLAAHYGASGIVVSNHGGRQHDRTVRTLDVLEDIVQEVGNELEVIIDSGVRSGTDLFIALAMGAKAIFVGRPMLWGLASGGMQGVLKAIDILHEELKSTMIIAGTPTIEEIDRTYIHQ